MKICYLILAHNNPNHLERLVVRILDKKNTSIFIHIDQKSRMSDFKHIAKEDVVFITDREAVHWGEFSIVQATINLIKSALDSGNNYDYYCLLSGNDYQLLPYKDFANFLSQNKGREFISLVEMPNRKASKPINRIKTFNIQNNEFPKLTPLYLKKIITRITRKILPPRDYNKALIDMKPFAGSQWWVLSSDAIRYIMNFINLNQSFVKFYRNTHIPDESFFHTIIGNSTFMKKTRKNLWFTDWSHTNGHRPGIISFENLNNIKSKNFYFKSIYGEGLVFFARKFQDNSKEITSHIDTIFSVKTSNKA